MASKGNPLPAGYHTATPYLTVNNCGRAIDFYKKAFRAEEITRMETPDGKIGHAEIKIGDSVIMLGDEMPTSPCHSPQSLGGTTVGILLYVADVDLAFRRALDAGAKADMHPADMFWGDRYGRLIDPFGHSWSVATHIEDLAPDEIKKRMKEAMAQMGQPS